jgi:hypothetical protein
MAAEFTLFGVFGINLFPILEKFWYFDSKQEFIQRKYGNAKSDPNSD